ncbi:hypothetical protein MY10362_002553 [Beauveria mimosiformis]
MLVRIIIFSVVFTESMLRQFARLGSSRPQAAFAPMMLRPRLGPLLYSGRVAAHAASRPSNSSTPIGQHMLYSIWPKPPMANVERTLKHDKVAADNGKWGFVIFRTAYGGDSDEKFARLLEALNTRAKESLETYERMDLAPLMEFLVVQDREKLESVTTYEVREQFAQWAVDRGIVLNNPLDWQAGGYGTLTGGGNMRSAGGYGTLTGGGNMRYEFCLLADWRSINSTMATPRPESYNSYMVPFIGVVQMGYMSEEQELGLRNDWDEDGNASCEQVAIEGNTEDNVGWYHLPLADVVGDYDNVYTLEGGMERARPPMIQNREVWPLDDEEPWKGDVAEGHWKGAQYHIDRWARGEKRERTGSWPRA